MSDKIFTLKQASKYLGVHTATLYRLARIKKIPGFKVGWVWRFKKQKLDAWIDKQSEVK